MSEQTQAASQNEPKLQFCVLHVARTYDLTPHMRRIVLTGIDLGSFDVPTNALGPYIKLLIPPAGIETPAWPTMTPDGRVIWPDADKRPVMRTYSVRKFDKDARELHVDFVMHGDRGVASGWAARAQAGDCVGVWGPGCATAQNIDWYLFAGDQTALPAISFIMENLPRSAQGQAFIEILDESERQVLNKPSGIEIQWLYSRGSSSRLQDAVKNAAWPSDSRVFVWAGAERAAARSIRSYMRKNHKLDSSQMYILNYWRRGASEGEFGYVE